MWQHRLPLAMMTDFTHFVGVDWTGAKGRRHAGLAVAACETGEVAPKVITPPSGAKNWSRAECTSWIAEGLKLKTGERVLVGLDSSFGMPFVDEYCYLENAGLPEHGRGLWGYVDKLCTDAEDFYGGPFVDLYSDFYLRTGARGSRYRRRMRVAEQLAVDSGAGPCESVFHLIGPSQVGLSGLSTMRMLHQFAGHDHIAIWPFEEPGDASVVVVEIYAAAFAALGGHKGKVRDTETLKVILENLGVSRPFRTAKPLSDHMADACITAAALRMIAHDPKYWNPAALSPKVRQTEGWVFGIK